MLFKLFIVCGLIAIGALSVLGSGHGGQDGR